MAQYGNNVVSDNVSVPRVIITGNRGRPRHTVCPEQLVIAERGEEAVMEGVSAIRATTRIQILKEM